MYSSHVANRKLNSATSYKRLQRTHWIGLSILKLENVSPSCRDIIVLMLKRKNFFLKFQLLCVHVLTFYSKKTEGKGGGGTVRRPLPMLRPCGLFRLLDRFPFVKKIKTEQKKKKKKKKKEKKQYSQEYLVVQLTYSSCK